MLDSLLLACMLYSLGIFIKVLGHLYIKSKMNISYRGFNSLGEGFDPMLFFSLFQNRKETFSQADFSAYSNLFALCCWNDTLIHPLSRSEKSIL